MIVAVDDPLDPRLEPYLAVRERDLVGRRGCFIAKGVVVLERLVTSARHETLSVLVAQKRIVALRPILERLDPGVPVFVAAQSVMDAVVGFHIHRGVLALGRAAPDPDPAALLRALGPRSLVVALFGVANHDNMGGVFRNAAAFGVDAVLLESQCCHPLYRKAIRVSVGGVLMVPFACLPAGADLVALLEQAGFECLALSPAGALALADLSRPPRCAVLLGAEGPGLPTDVRAHARGVGIPMSDGFDSLNLAVASGIVLHHLSRGVAPLHFPARTVR